MLSHTSVNWGEGRDSNPQPTESQSVALPLSYRHHRKTHSFPDFTAVVPYIFAIAPASSCQVSLLPLNVFIYGASGEIRTPNLQFRRLTFYPIELQTHIEFVRVVPPHYRNHSPELTSPDGIR